MKSLQLDLPDQVASRLDELVKAGHYQTTQEAICHAVREFLRQQSGTLSEQHHREDIAWALREASHK